MRFKRPRVIVTSIALMAMSIAHIGRAQLTHAEATGVVDNVVGADLDLLGGAKVGDAWQTTYSLPAALSLVSIGTNWAVYHTTVDALATVAVGTFSATASDLTLKISEKEPLTLKDGTPAMADMIQLSGYVASSGLLIQTSWLYPVGTIDRFIPAVPVSRPAIIDFELVVLRDGASALVESHAELRSLEASFSPVPEASTYGWFAALSLCSLIGVRASRKTSPSGSAT